MPIPVSINYTTQNGALVTYAMHSLVFHEAFNESKAIMRTEIVILFRSQCNATSEIVYHFINFVTGSPSASEFDVLSVSNGLYFASQCNNLEFHFSIQANFSDLYARTGWKVLGKNCNRGIRFIGEIGVGVVLKMRALLLYSTTGGGVR